MPRSPGGAADGTTASLAELLCAVCCCAGVEAADPAGESDAGVEEDSRLLPRLEGAPPHSGHAEAKSSIFAFCADVPRTRVLPTDEELDVQWQRCRHFSDEALAEAFHEQLMEAAATESWSHARRALKLLGHVYSSGGGLRGSAWQERRRGRRLGLAVARRCAPLMRHLAAHGHDFQEGEEALHAGDADAAPQSQLASGAGGTGADEDIDIMQFTEGGAQPGQQVVLEFEEPQVGTSKEEHQPHEDLLPFWQASDLISLDESPEPAPAVGYPLPKAATDQQALPEHFDIASVASGGDVASWSSDLNNMYSFDTHGLRKQVPFLPCPHRVLLMDTAITRSDPFAFVAEHMKCQGC